MLYDREGNGKEALVPASALALPVRHAGGAFVSEPMLDRMQEIIGGPEQAGYEPIEPPRTHGLIQRTP